VLSYSLDGLAFDGSTVMTIALAEGLEAHARAVSVRLAMAYGADEETDEKEADE